MPPYDNNTERGYSRDYKKFKEEEKEVSKQTRYEKLCIFMGGLLNIKAGDTSREKLLQPLKLLKWDLSPGMVLSAAVGTAFFSLIGWVLLFLLNSALGSIIPLSLMLLTGFVPFGVGIYVYYKPIFEAKNKVIKASGEMILAVLYMVIYIRTSPNLEGAIRFAALNLEGPLSKDLRGILWDVETGRYNSVGESLHEYTKVWKGYNDDFLESLQIIEAAMNDPDAERREEMLQQAIDGILRGTREKMKHYAQGLKMPVMILNALGAMLPVLGMIMLPLISVFMGGVVTPMHLFLLFNIMLPITLYWFMQRLLTSRPPTTSTKPSEQGNMPPRGKVSFEMLGKEFHFPAWIIGTAVFLVISIYGWIGYISTIGAADGLLLLYPASDIQISNVPGLFVSDGNLAPLPMLLRSLSITLGVGAGIGTSKLLGNRQRKAAEDDLKNIEAQFPDALFQLGNKISGGTPIEVALKEAAEATKEMRISDLFDKASHNIRNLGMTFEDALFHPYNGALTLYPSELIKTVMKASLQSSKKGTDMAAMTMLTISRYLKNIHKTQEELTDLMQETTTTIQMMGYLLAPVVSGIAVGMSQTIMTALFRMSQSFSNTNTNIPEGAGTGASAGGFGGILGNLQNAIPPELLQFVVGIYLVQLLYILGTFYMKIVEGENPTYRNMFIGKLMLIGMMFYSIVVVVVALLFGGVVSSVAT